MGKVKPCCPKFDPKPFDEKEMTLDGKLFVQDTVYSLFYIPITFTRAMNRICAKLIDNKAHPKPEDAMTLQQVYPCSPWSSQIFVMADKEIPDVTMTKLPGKFYTKVYKGPYSKVGEWVKDMQVAVKNTKGQETSKIFAFYPYCPGCIKTYGENFVVMMAQIE